MNISAIYSVHCSGEAVSHICISLCEYMRDDSTRVSLWVPTSDPPGRRPFIIDAIPPILKNMAINLDGQGKLISKILEYRYLRALAPGDIAYIWPGLSLRLYQRIKARGHTIIMERINTHRATSKKILDQAYQREGWPITHSITPQDMHTETAQLELTDYAFAPSPIVRQSLLDAGVPNHKILSASYGYDPTRLQGHTRALDPADGPTVLFVGRIGLRKGAHLLLRTWRNAKIKGRLILAGRIEQDILDHCSHLLDRPDIIHLGYVPDIGSVYRSADIIAFPTLEEGSPLISYEALALGIPMITTPMGAGELIRHMQEGIILDPYDQQAWIHYLHLLATDKDLHHQLSQNSTTRAKDHTWPKVAQHRLQLLKNTLGK